MPSERETARRWLNDMRHNIAMAEAFGSIDYEAFKDDNWRLYAVLRCLEIISEASRRLPAEVKARRPSIDWQQMAAAGNIYRHDYETVAPRRVWQTLTGSLPPLLAIVEAELARLQ